MTPDEVFAHHRELKKGQAKVAELNQANSLTWRGTTSSSCFSASANLKVLALMYSSTASPEIHRRFKFSATAPVVFEPANGSTTRSFSSVSNLIKNIGSTAGNRAG